MLLDGLMISVDLLTELVELFTQGTTTGVRCTELLLQAETFVDNCLMTLLGRFKTTLSPPQQDQ